MNYGLYTIWTESTSMFLEIAVDFKHHLTRYLHNILVEKEWFHVARIWQHRTTVGLSWYLSAALWCSGQLAVVNGWRSLLITPQSCHYLAVIPLRGLSSSWFSSIYANFLEEIPFSGIFFMLAVIRPEMLPVSVWDTLGSGALSHGHQIVHVCDDVVAGCGTFFF